MEAAIAEGRAARPARRPRVVGEEAVAADPGVRAAAGAELAVIVDPLDGTWNFAHGVAVFGVILAVARRGEPVWGLLYDPLLDDWVVARRGGGGVVRPPRRGPRPARRGARGPARGDDGLRAAVPVPARAAASGRGGHAGPRAGRRRCAARAMSTGCSCRGMSTSSWAPTWSPGDHAAGVLALREAGGSRRTPRRAGLRLPASPRGRLLAAGTRPALEALRARFGQALS